MRTNERNFSYLRKKISVYTKKNFCIYEKIFLHIQKFISLRTEISPPAEGGKKMGGDFRLFAPSQAASGAFFGFLPQPSQTTQVSASYNSIRTETDSETSLPP
ncbi:hypothetical protein HQ39_05590 [Porphyromonas sp. COT-108 OH2963]|nr:hypothetical protein HQ39_05590 [Porphyromonas sp. COT-108 OH2963]